MAFNKFFEIDGEIEDNDGNSSGDDTSNKENAEIEDDDIFEIVDEDEDDDDLSLDAEIEKETEQEPSEEEQANAEVISQEETPVEEEPALPVDDFDEEETAEPSKEEPAQPVAEQEEQEEVAEELPVESLDEEPVNAENSTAEVEPVVAAEEAPQAEASEEDPLAGEEESFEDVFGPAAAGSGKGGGSLFYATLALFIISFCMLAYYQFYDGHGGISLSFKHKGAGGGEAPIQEVKSPAPQAAASSEEIAKLKKGLAGALKEQKELQKELSSAKAAALTAASEKTEGTTKSSAPASADVSKGTVYQIQLVSLKTDKDAGKVNQELGQLYLDQQGGMNKLVIGAYASKGEAVAAQAKLKELGMASFVIKKVNGKR